MYHIYSNTSHNRVQDAPLKLGPEFGTKFFQTNLKVMLEMLSDTHSDYRSSSLTVVKTMFLLFMHDSPCFFSIFTCEGYSQQIKLIRMLRH